MNDSLFDQIQVSAKYLSLDLNAQEMARFSEEQKLDDGQIESIASVFAYLKNKKQETIVTTLLRLSRLPLKEPKTFDNFDFSQLHGKQTSVLKNLPTLSAL